MAGPDLFVASAGTGGGRGSVTEVDIATGDLVTVLSGSGYKFDGPGQMALSGADLFVVNNFGQSVTELDASTGALVGVLGSSQYQLVQPAALAVVGPDLFVASGDGGPLVEIDTGTSKLVKAFSGPRTSSTGRRPWRRTARPFRNGPGCWRRQAVRSSSWTARRAAVVRVLSAASYEFDEPVALAVDGPICTWRTTTAVR